MTTMTSLLRMRLYRNLRMKTEPVRAFSVDSWSFSSLIVMLFGIKFRTTFKSVRNFSVSTYF